MLILYLLFGVIVLFLLLAYLSVYPFLIELLNNKVYFNKDVSKDHYMIAVVQSSKNMFLSKKVLMSERDTDFKENLKFFIGRGRKHPYFYYPKAFLYYGFLSHLESTKPSEINKLQAHFDRMLDDSGKPSFLIRFVDQVPFGMTALNLYIFTGDEKYRVFCDSIFEYLKNSYSSQNGILYRSSLDIQFNDVLGMICPFLFRYAISFNVGESAKMGLNQILLFYKNGVDKESSIPSHGYYLSSKVKLGSSNWGRGIGWYAYALAYCPNELGIISIKQDLFNSLLSLSLPDGTYSQFPGSSNVFDASSTVLIWYFMKDLDPNFISKEEIIKVLSRYTTVDGCIDFTSGDTFGLNMYSRKFGFSELSQGILLQLLNL